jgi:hypothetical protein
MTAKRNVTGQKFGMLTAQRRLGTRCRNSLWLFQCDCGAAHESLLCHVTSGKTQSCGCMRSSKRSKMFVHGETHTPLHEIWKSMRQRCSNPKNKRFARYGGRGITVAPEWGDYVAFRDWAMANGYAPGLSIEREDNDSGYSPDNCRWTTMGEQARNKISNRIVVVEGKPMSMIEASEAVGIPYSRLRARLTVQKLSDADALGRPSRYRE